MTFASLFTDFGTDTIEAQFVTRDIHGGFLASGAAVSIPCYIEGGNKLVRDMTGREVVSTYTVVTFAINNLSVVNHRFSLTTLINPPKLNMQAIRIDAVRDETGPIYEVLYLP